MVQSLFTHTQQLRSERIRRDYCAVAAGQA